MIRQPPQRYWFTTHTTLHMARRPRPRMPLTVPFLPLRLTCLPKHYYYFVLRCSNKITALPWDTLVNHLIHDIRALHVCDRYMDVQNKYVNNCGYWFHKSKIYYRCVNCSGDIRQNPDLPSNERDGSIQLWRWSAILLDCNFLFLTYFIEFFNLK